MVCAIIAFHAYSPAFVSKNTPMSAFKIHKQVSSCKGDVGISVVTFKHRIKLFTLEGSRGGLKVSFFRD